MELSVRVGNVEAEGLDKPYLLDKLLAIPDPAMERTRAAKLRLNDGLRHFFDVDTEKFPAGLVHRLVKRLEARGHTVSLLREPPVQFAPTPSDYLVGKDLRDYQIEAIDAALTHARGILWMATNSGKSACISAIAGRLVREARARVVVVVPNAYLLNQTGADIAQMLGPDVCVGLAGDKKRTLRCDILVGTYQTLVAGAPTERRPPEDPELGEWLRSAKAVLIDEAHHAAAIGYQRILTACVGASFRIGCTGSLDKSDKRAEGERKEGSEDVARLHRWMVEAYLGPLLYRVDNEFLISRGYSAVPRFYVVRDRAAFGPIVRTPKPVRSGPGAGSHIYNTVFQRACVEDARWHRSITTIVARLLQIGRPPFVFSHSVRLLDKLEGVMDAAKVPCRVLHGEHDTDLRRSVVREFEEQGDFAVLASSVFDEGASIPAIRSVVFAGARKSPVELLQRIGRGVRRKAGDDNTVIVVDFDPVHTTMMHDHFEARLATYRDEGFKVRYVDDLSQIADLIA